MVDLSGVRIVVKPCVVGVPPGASVKYFGRLRKSYDQIVDFTILETKTFNVNGFNIACVIDGKQIDVLSVIACDVVYIKTSAGCFEFYKDHSAKFMAGGEEFIVVLLK